MDREGPCVNLVIMYVSVCARYTVGSVILLLVSVICSIVITTRTP